MSIIYPYPSHVCAPNFVSVKLSGRDMYDLWRKQMLCLLEGHDMFGFINGTLISSSSDSNHKLWKRSDSLVQGWILGSLSEQVSIRVLHHLKSKQQQNMDFTAKDIWDQVQIMYHPQADQSDKRKDRVGGSETSFHYPNLEDKLKEEKSRAKKHERVYLAAERGKWKELHKILQKTHIEITECISLNGNTALHVAVASSTAEDDLLNNMLNLLPKEKSLSEVRNLEGSTLLHIAAVVGRVHAAKVLMKRSPQLLFEKDNRGQTPLDIVLSNPKRKDMCITLLNELESQTTDLEQQGNHFVVHEEPLVNVISYGHFDLAKVLIKKYDPLKSDAVFMAIVQHWPTDFSLCESIVYELWEKPIISFVTRLALDFHFFRVLHKGLTKFANCAKGIGARLAAPFERIFAKTFFTWPFKVLLWMGVYIKVFKNLNEKAKRQRDAMELLDTLCGLIKFSTCQSSYPDFYTEPLCEAIRRDVSNVVEKMAFWFPSASTVVDEDGHNIAQAAWKNRALKVLALSVNVDMHMAAEHLTLIQKTRDDPFGNTILHFVARLAPKEKLHPISGPPFILQRELRWFMAAKKALPASVMEKNCFGETPDMVFTREHKELLLEGGKWMQNTANGYIVAAALIITIMFAAAITVPGGNDDENGFPRFEDNPAFIVFAASIAVSMVTATTSLLLFLSIMTSRFAESDFKLKLPLTLVIGFLNLFISAAFMILAFGAAWFLLFWKKHPWTLSLVALLIGQQIVFFSIYQSNLVFDLLTSTSEFEIAYLFTRLRVLGRVLI